MSEFHIERVLIDRDLEESLGVPQGVRFSIEGDDVSLEHISYREFQAWLREHGIRQHSLVWEEPSGMTVADVLYCNVTVGADEEEA